MNNNDSTDKSGRAAEVTGRTVPAEIRQEQIPETVFGSDDADALIDSFINKEKQLASNPFLVTRVMEEISQRSYTPSVYERTIKPVLIGVSVAAALFIGISAGNLVDPKTNDTGLPAEFAYFNDATLEPMDMFNLANHE